MSSLVSQYFFHRMTARCIEIAINNPPAKGDRDFADLVAELTGEANRIERCKKEKQQQSKKEKEKLQLIQSTFVDCLRHLLEWRAGSGNLMATTSRKCKAKDRVIGGIGEPNARAGRRTCPRSSIPKQYFY